MKKPKPLTKADCKDELQRIYCVRKDTPSAKKIKELCDQVIATLKEKQIAVANCQEQCLSQQVVGT